MASSTNPQGAFLPQKENRLTLLPKTKLHLCDFQAREWGPDIWQTERLLLLFLHEGSSHSRFCSKNHRKIPVAKICPMKEEVARIFKTSLMVSPAIEPCRQFLGPVTLPMKTFERHCAVWQNVLEKNLFSRWSLSRTACFCLGFVCLSVSCHPYIKDRRVPFGASPTGPIGDLDDMGLVKLHRHSPACVNKKGQLSSWRLPELLVLFEWTHPHGAQCYLYI